MNEPSSPLFTAFGCDRCGKENAIRLAFIMSEDNKGNKVRKSFDMCSNCIINLCGCLFHKVDAKDKEAWMRAFLSNVIG